MRFCARVRSTAAALIKKALKDASATITADVAAVSDTPVPAGKTSHILIRADDKRTASGTPAAWRTDVSLDIALRIAGTSAENAQSRTDALIELIEEALLGGIGWSLNMTTVADSKTATPSDMSDLAVGMAITGTGLGNDTYIAALDSDAGTITLSAAAGQSGTFAVTAGSFTGLFEELDAMDTACDYDGTTGAYHIWCADLSLSGHVSESFAQTADIDLSGLSLSVTVSSDAYGSATSDALDTEFLSED